MRTRYWYGAGALVAAVGAVGMLSAWQAYHHPDGICGRCAALQVRQAEAVCPILGGGLVACKPAAHPAAPAPAGPSAADPAVEPIRPVPAGQVPEIIDLTGVQTEPLLPLAQATPEPPLAEGIQPVEFLEGPAATPVCPADPPHPGHQVCEPAVGPLLPMPHLEEESEPASPCCLMGMWKKACTTVAAWMLPKHHAGAASVPSRGCDSSHVPPEMLPMPKPFAGCADEDCPIHFEVDTMEFRRGDFTIEGVKGARPY